jgi:4-amino-4-deoxy-L-arabinose transferase-like glycosyltransferase
MMAAVAAPDGNLKKTDPLIWLFITLAVIYTVALFNHGPVPSMEPRFAEAVREMLARGEWLIPIKNGVPYIEYPPLYFWLGIAATLIGLPLLAAIRLPAYIGLLLWVWWLVRLQKELFPQWPRWLLALTAAALPAILYNFFIAQSDSLLILGTLIAFSGFVRLRTDPKRRAFSWELWLGVLLATAAKGPVGLAITLPAMAEEIVVAALVSARPVVSSGRDLGRRWAWLCREAVRMTPVRGLALALLGIVPWYIAAGLTVNWQFVRAVLVYQNFTRFLVGFDHLQPWWMYGQTLWGDLWPLSLLLPFGIYFGVRHAREFRWRVLLVWTVWTLLFFTVSASKQSKYILPAAPAMALLSLAAVPLLFHGRWVEWVRSALQIWAVGLILLFGVLVIAVLPFHDRRIGGLAGFEKIRATVAAAPGKLVSFQWPRPMTLYVLGAPMAYVRSSRELYAEIHAGKINPGDYILVDTKYLPGGGQPDDRSFLPVPQAPYFRQVLKVKAEDPMMLYRVLPRAAVLPMPATPAPPPFRWWQQFDTD